VISRLIPLLVGAGLLAAAAWLLTPGEWVRYGATLEPAHLSLEPGEERIVRLVNREPQIVALSFTLRFDETIVAIDAVEPVHRSILAGGNAIAMPIRRRPGRIDVPGLAIAGGRVFDPAAPVHRLTVRGVTAGTTELAVEGLTVVDSGEARRVIPVTPARITVRAP
jgi:hypothetical protein